MGSNAMLFRIEARKCNHWATEGLLKCEANSTVPISK